MEIYLTNSTTHKKEKFIPLDYNDIKIYCCGPTVYDKLHIGNYRSVVIFDSWYRLLKLIYPHVTYARNITNIDDKIINKAKELNISIEQLTNDVIVEFHENCAALHCLAPSYEPRVSEHIESIIDMILQLINRKHAYISNNHVFFDITSYKDYGSLSGRTLSNMIAGHRVETQEDKKHPMDFVLWKPSKDGEEKASYNSPWGLGRPGWHIECSAMIDKILGKNIDIHCGGNDLIFPHHENEVAQSKCANDNVAFASYWLHNGMITVDGVKMSKSLGNIIHLEEIDDLEALRLLFLSTHYRKPLDFNKKKYQDNLSIIKKIKSIFNQHPNVRSAPLEECYDIMSFICNDLNLAPIFSLIHEYISEIHKGNVQNLSKLRFICDFLSVAPCDKSIHGVSTLNYDGINIEYSAEVNYYILSYVKKRQDYKRQSMWQKADEVRKQIYNLGYTLEDSKNTVLVKKTNQGNK